MLPNTHTLLEDMLNRCARIQRYARDLPLEAYLADELVRDGVERNFIALGEMISRLRRTDPRVFDMIRGSENILGLRNRIAHGYDAEINDQTIWLTVQQSIPVLQDEIVSILKTGYTDL
jgi:uncharacterized protein with HEPN domain